MILSRSWISVPCLSMSLISLSWPGLCVLLTFITLFDAMVVSHITSWLYFLMSSLVFSSMVLHISTYSMGCLSSSYSTSSRRFLDFSGLLVVLTTLGVLCWIMSVMVSLMVSMSSSSFSVSNRFLNSSWNSIFFYPICLTSTFVFSLFFFSI